jgi:hypothetical protein
MRKSKLSYRPDYIDPVPEDQPNEARSVFFYQQLPFVLHGALNDAKNVQLHKRTILTRIKPLFDNT